MPRYRRPRPKVEERSGPSAFFIIALLLGLIFLAFGFWQFTQNPAAVNPTTTTQQSTT